MNVLLTPGEVAAWSRLTRQSVTLASRRGELRGVKLGGSWRFTVEAVRDWSGFPDVTVAEIRAAAEREADQSSGRAVSEL